MSMGDYRSRGKRRFFRNKGFAAIPFSATISLLTLADGVVIDANVFTNNFTENFYAISMKGTWSLRNATVNEGPLTFGMAHSDYSVTEISEKLTSDESNVRGDKIEVEQASRAVRRAGVFPGAPSSGDVVHNDGRVSTLPLKFLIGNGFNIAMWVRNQSGGTLTTGAQVVLNGTVYGRFTS